MYVYYKWFGSPATIFGAFLSLYEWPCPVQTQFKQLLMPSSLIFAGQKQQNLIN